MTKDEAAKECERLNREHPDGSDWIWFPQEREPGRWQVVRAKASGLTPRGKVVAEQQPSPPRPDPAQDVPQDPAGWP